MSEIKAPSSSALPAGGPAEPHQRRHPLDSAPHVALVIETSHAYGRGMLQGIRRYVSEHGHWSIFAERRSLESPLPRWLKHWQGNGLIVRCPSQAMLQAVIETGLPFVDARFQFPEAGVPSVRTDDYLVGRMAAEHFLEQGFREFGCFIMNANAFPFHGHRHEGFCGRLAQAGHSCRVLELGGRQESNIDWEEQQRTLIGWISAMPHPVAILTGTDQLGFWLLEACRTAGIAVPERVAVVGVEDDEALCRLSTPRLSSVRLDVEKVGYEAAALLDRLMSGEPPPREPLSVLPLGVVVRQSSDVVAITDPDVAAALSFIRQKACSGICVEDVVSHVCVSRSTLETRMRQLLGRSPNAEIVRVRLENARRLLMDTDLSLERISQRCGFNYVQYLNKLFKKHFEETPGAFRMRCRSDKPQPHPGK